MSRASALSAWTAEVSKRMTPLSKTQARTLALWSFGMVMTQSCGQTTVAVFIAALLGQVEGSVRQRLREWCWDAADKPGQRRREVVVEHCFGALLGWIISVWPPEEKRLALALDATTLGQRFTVLVVSVLYRGCAVPVAWVVLPATRQGCWRPHWVALLRALQGVVPPEWLVIVTADRGLYAPWLFKCIQRRGWHPFLRIKQQATFRPEGSATWRPLSHLFASPGTHWVGRVTCFKTRPLRCTLLACWSYEHKNPWLILTDLAPHQADVAWYGLRVWIECGFKDTKRGGWDWQATQMEDPQRAARLWLAIAVATLWVVTVGGQADPALQEPVLNLELPLDLEQVGPTQRRSPQKRAARRPSTRSRPRLLSCFRRGILLILAALLGDQPLPLGRFHPEPWPVSPACFCPHWLALPAPQPSTLL